jgi:tRNA 2-thiouridine synthesizing protein A
MLLQFYSVCEMSTNAENSVKTIDVRGLFCPEPVFRTKIEMEKMATGDALKIVSDDPDSEEDISRWVQRNGHKLLSLNKNQQDLEFIIRKNK